MSHIMNMEVGSGVSVAGTSLVGNVNSTYAELVQVFGEPTLLGGDKTTAEWQIRFNVMEDGDTDTTDVVATIYDWKEYDTPMGPYDWHVGGNSANAAWYVSDKLDEHRSSH